jgi:hypothetical protein
MKHVLSLPGKLALVALVSAFMLKGLLPPTMAQGNLQFNRVLFVLDTLKTVPTGKIWKIESIAINASGNLAQAYANLNITGSGTCANTDVSNAYFIINGAKRVCAGIGNSSGADVVPASCCFPLWLPAGATLRTQCPAAVLSVVEFNIVQ